MSILDKIVEHKKKELELNKRDVTVNALEDTLEFKHSCISLQKNLLDEHSSGIIAEFKRKSPSKGWIREHANVEAVASIYDNNGVSAMSCLTDSHFFGGSNADFLQARKVFSGPMLRKDFIIDTYQIYESKSIGADVILLIAAILTKEQVIEFTDLAHKLGMEVLMEFHHKKELDKFYNKVDFAGINNRDLNDFSVSLLTSIDMKRRFPEGTLLISESGLDHPGIVNDLYQYGFHGFLIGEFFMKHNAIEDNISKFISSLEERKQKRRA